MIIERVFNGRTVIDGFEDFQFFVSHRGPNVFNHVDASERTNAIDTFGIAEFLVVGELQVRPGLHVFGDVIQVILWVEDFQLFTGAALQTNVTVVKLQAFAWGDQAKVSCWEDCKFINGFAIGFRPILDDLDAKLGRFNLSVEIRKDAIASGSTQSPVHAARNCKSGVD